MKNDNTWISILRTLYLFVGLLYLCFIVQSVTTKKLTADDVCTWVYAYLLQPLVKYSQVTRDNGCDFVLSVLHIYRGVVQKGVRLKETVVAAAKNRS